MNETIEIIREARKAGLQTACLLFGSFLVVSLLFGFYIYKSYNNTPITMSATQDGANNNMEQTNG